MTTKKSKRCESKRRVSKRRVYRRRGSKKRISKRKSRRNLKKKYVGGGNDEQTKLQELQTKLQELVDITHRIGQYYMINTRAGLRLLPRRSGGRNDKIIKAINFLKGNTQNLDSGLVNGVKGLTKEFNIIEYAAAIKYLKEGKKKISCDTNYLFFDESDGEVYINLYKVDDTFTYLKFPFFNITG
jgi:hypothetical protein